MDFTDDVNGLVQGPPVRTKLKLRLCGSDILSQLCYCLEVSVVSHPHVFQPEPLASSEQIMDFHFFYASMNATPFLGWSFCLFILYTSIKGQLQ